MMRHSCRVETHFPASRKRMFASKHPQLPQARRIPFRDRASPATVGLPSPTACTCCIFPADFADRRGLAELAWIDTHPASADATDLSSFHTVVSSLNFRPLRDVLVADDFSNADASALPNAPPAHTIDET